MTEDVKFRLTAKDATGAAFGSVERSLGRIRAEAAVATSRLAALGGPLVVLGSAAATFTAATAAIASTVRSMADLDDAAESTGASVESLSSLLNTLAPTGVTLDTISDAAGKLVRAMSSADEESSKAGVALKALGVSTRDASGNLRPVDDVLVDLAKTLAQYEDGANKTAIAQAIFGRSGATLLPVLKDLATRQREAATVSTEQAAAAEEVANALRSIGVEARKAAETMAGPLIKAVADIVRAFNEARQSGLGFLDSIQAATMPDSMVRFAIEEQRRLIEVARGNKRIEEELQRRNPNLRADPSIMAAIDAEIAQRERAIDALTKRLAKLDPAVAEGEMNGAARRQRDQAPRLPTDDDGERRRRQLSEVEDYAARVRRAVAEAVTGSDLVKAREFADQVAELDRLFFDAGLAADVYESAMRRLTRSTETAGKESEKATADLDALITELERMERVADVWLDQIEPSRQYLRQLEEIRKLVEGGRLTPQQGFAAEFIVQNRLQDALDGPEKKIKETDDAARQLGLTFQSAFEDAVIEGRKFSDVLNAIAKDITRLFLRKTVTEPFIKALEGSNIFGGLFGATTGAAASASGNASAPAASAPAVTPVSPKAAAPTIYQTVTVSGEVSRADVYNAMVRAKSEAVAEIAASMNRGGAFARG